MIYSEIKEICKDVVWVFKKTKKLICGNFKIDLKHMKIIDYERIFKELQENSGLIFVDAKKFGIDINFTIANKSSEIEYLKPKCKIIINNNEVCKCLDFNVNSKRVNESDAIELKPKIFKEISIWMETNRDIELDDAKIILYDSFDQEISVPVLIKTN